VIETPSILEDTPQDIARKARHKRYNHSEKGRARYLKYYQEHQAESTYARFKRRLKQRIVSKRQAIERMLHD
jgi:hypothetical protein